jgi:RNA polymerase sigma factor (sigma-70 family)
MTYQSTVVIPDDQLIQCLLNNDHAALKAFTYLNKDRIYKSIYAIVQDKYIANDIFQEVFIFIIDSMISGKYIEEGKFLPRAMQIAHDLCISHLKKAKYAPAIEIKNESPHEMTAYFKIDKQASINHDRHHDIRKMIDMLPNEEREVIVLRHYADLSFKEIAEVMKCTITAALNRMRYALSILCRIMEEKQVAF